MSSPYAQRFNVALGVLAGVAVAAVVIAVALLAGNTSNGSGEPWSQWVPPDSGSQAAREIADHIAPLYRISGVNQLAVVTVSSLSDPSTIQAQAASGTSSSSGSGRGLVVAVRPNVNSSAISLLPGKTIAFNLCGLGSTNCSIGVGTPSADRLLLLRREALELALYTFKYVSGVQNVVAILPPGRTMASTTSRLSAKPPTSSSQTSAPSKPVDLALVFQRSELAPFLSHPVSALFPEQFPPTVAQVPLWKQTTEAGYVEQITARGLFSEHLTTAQDGTNLIVLDPQPPS